MASHHSTIPDKVNQSNNSNNSNNANNTNVNNERSSMITLPFEVAKVLKQIFHFKAPMETLINDIAQTRANVKLIQDSNPNKITSLKNLQEKYVSMIHLCEKQNDEIFDCLEQISSVLRSNRLGQTHSINTSYYKRKELNAAMNDKNNEDGHPAPPKKAKNTNKNNDADFNPSTPHNNNSNSTNQLLSVYNPNGPDRFSVKSTVAALIDEDSSPKLWILAQITSIKPGPANKTRYEVLDLDPGDSDHPRKRYTLDINHLIPLPPLNIWPTSSRREFAKGERVIAVYPEGGITVLYPAEVIAGPKKRKNDTYLLVFDDDDDVERVVSVANVAQIPPQWQ